MSATETAESLRPSAVARASVMAGKKKASVLELLAPLGVPIMILAIMIYFSLATRGFLTVGNFKDIFSNSALPIVVAVGLTLPLVTGEFDLSISAVAGFATILYAQLVAKEDVNPAIAIAVTLVASVAAGAFNGLMVAYIRLPALVATIAVSSFLTGMQFYVSGSIQIYGGYPESLVHFARSNLGPVPALVIVAAIIVVAIWLLLDRTMFGRHVKHVQRPDPTRRSQLHNVRLSRRDPAGGADLCPRRRSASVDLSRMGARDHDLATLA